ncbi:MAG: hypothetical protein NC347_02915 [Clostridium sp.]|nr:hypothetical protein [Clostridium sp.]
MQLKQPGEPSNGNLNYGQGNPEHTGNGLDESLPEDDFMNQFEEPAYVSSMPEPKKKDGKQIAALAFILLLFGGMSIWCLLSGAKGLFLANTHPMDEAFTNLIKGDVYEGQIMYISPEVGELKHTINFIPAGTEHFYLMFSEDGEHVVPIRAPKDWHNQYTGDSVQTVSLQGRGMVRQMDSEVRSEFSSYVTAFGEEGIKMEPNLYVDLTSNKISILQIIAGILMIICLVYFTLIADKEVVTTGTGSFRSPAAFIVSALALVAAGMLIYVMNMAGF